MILSELNALLDEVKVPVETGYFSSKAPAQYAVLTPLTEDFELFADNTPQIDTQQVRLTLYAKGNYLYLRRIILQRLLAENFTITSRNYIQYDRDSGYHQYAIDVAKTYRWED